MCERSDQMKPVNIEEWYDHGLYLSKMNDDGTVTAINKSDLIETELNYELGIEPNNLIGRILLIIIAIPFMFKAMK
ncbi:MAG TPA: hypothetical protein VK094_00275 [Pseudogracilibacillus sp.]|nr:hypothetical protein [Pseudogracilibacillus sp.]